MYCEKIQSPYDPNKLLDGLLVYLELKNDTALSHAIGVSPTSISKIRHRRLPVGATLLVRMHEITGLTIKELRLLMGDRRSELRFSNKPLQRKKAPGA